MLKELDAIAEDLAYTTTVDCIIIDSKSEKAFSTGADIKEWGSLSNLQMGHYWVRKGHAVFDKWANLPQPTIGIVNEFAYGGGLEFALTFDFRLVDGTAQFATPEAKIGTVVGWGATQRLSHLISPSWLKWMLFTGESIDETKAKEIGLVDFILEKGKAHSFAKELATKIMQNSPVSIRLSKQIVNAYQNQGSTKTLENLAGTVAAYSEDGQEGYKSFIEKRKPFFQGK